MRVYASFATKTTNENVMSASVSTMDMISNIGGTLGLFSGFSILSAVEMAYWAFKYLRDKAVTKRRPRKTGRQTPMAPPNCQKRLRELEVYGTEMKMKLRSLERTDFAYSIYHHAE